MNGIFEAAGEVQRVLQSEGWRFCFIGGLAVIRWGQPRATQDVDVSLFVEFGQEAAYVDHLLRALSPRIPDARDFALANRVLLLSASNGTPVDIALAGFPYEERVIERATAFRFADDLSLITASAEDLLVLKAFAARPRDWDDVRTIVARSSSEMDWTYVVRELDALCELKDDRGPIEQLEQIRLEVGD